MRSRTRLAGVAAALLAVAGLTGCARLAAARAARTAAGATTGTIVAGGLDRTYTVYRPAGRTGKLPVVLVLHGGGGDGAGMRRLSGFDTAADKYGFIAVYPDGYRRSWADGRGSSAADQAGVDDVAFLGDLVTRVDTDDDGDPARTYVTGISNGGMMSYRLACDLAGRIRAFAPVAAGMPVPLDTGCHPARPVPMLEIAGTADPIVPYGGGPVTVLQTGGRGEVRSAPATAAMWASIDGCGSSPRAGTLPDAAADGTTTTTRTYTGCAGGGRVSLYSVAGGGHTWPGGSQYLPVAIVGVASRDFDASDVIGAFFASVG